MTWESLSRNDSYVAVDDWGDDKERPVRMSVGADWGHGSVYLTASEAMKLAGMLLRLAAEVKVAKDREGKE